MVLDFEKMDEISFGKVKMEHGEDGYSFQRFTKEQKDVWALRSPYYTEDFFDGYFLRNSGTDANITIDFLTDSKTIHIDVAKIESVNGSVNNKIEVFVNERKVLIIEEPSRYTVTIRKESRIRILFPYRGHAYLKSIEVEDGSKVLPVKHDIFWLCHGDSITHGCEAGLPSLTYVSRIARKYNVEVLNHGNAGYVNDERIVVEIPDWKPSIVTSAYGINDLCKKPFEDNKKDMIAQCKALKKKFSNSKIYLISPVWAAFLFEDENNFSNRDRMYEMFEEVSQLLDIPLIDGLKLIPHNRKYYMDDGVHPNAAGFAYYGARLGKILFEG